MEHENKQVKKKIICKRFNVNDDKKLISLVQEYHGNWEKIGKIMNRHKRVCKERYTNYLLPEYALWQWTTEEKIQLIYMKSVLNYNWKTINKAFPYRGPKKKSMVFSIKKTFIAINH